MQNFVFESFVVLDNEQWARRKVNRGDVYKHTFTGLHVFIPGALLPLIVRGVGCLGIVKILSVEMNESRTTLKFEGIESGEGYEGVYDMYRLSVSNRANMSDGGVNYDADDDASMGSSAPVAKGDVYSQLARANKNANRAKDRHSGIFSNFDD